MMKSKRTIHPFLPLLLLSSLFIHGVSAHAGDSTAIAVTQLKNQSILVSASEDQAIRPVLNQSVRLLQQVDSILAKRMSGAGSAYYVDDSGNEVCLDVTPEDLALIESRCESGAPCIKKVTQE